MEDEQNVTLQQWIDYLGAKKQGKVWVATCPAHDDHKPSLILSQGNKGVLMHCRAGCRTFDVLSALNLTWRDLFSDDQYERIDPDREWARALATALINRMAKD